MTPGGYPLQPNYVFDLPGTNHMRLCITAFEPGVSIASVRNAADQIIPPNLVGLEIFNLKIPTMPRENKPMENNTMMLNLVHNYRVTLHGQAFLNLTRAYDIEEYRVV